MRGLLGSPGTSSDGESDPEQLRYAPQPPRRFRWLRRLAVVGVVAGLVWGGATAAEGWLRTQYYVGELSGQVAIFRGVSQEIGPITLSQAHEPADGLPVGALPDVYREQVSNTITADDYDEAKGIVENLRNAACAAHARGQQTATSPPAAASSPTPTPTPTPLPTAPPGYPGLECPEES